MNKNEECFSAYIEVGIARFFFILPLILFLFVLYFKILEGLNAIIFLIICYIITISLGVYYKHYLDKKDSNKRMELRELEDKIFRKNLKK